MADGVVDEVNSGLTGVDHETVGELHRLGTGSTELARDDNLATLGTRLHDETEDTIASTTDGKTTEELVAERLALCDSGETTVLNLLGVKFERVLGESEALLDEGGEFADAAALLTKDFLGVGCADDDFGTGMGDTDVATRVTLLRELTGEEVVQLGAEDTVSDELALLADLGGHLDGVLAGENGG